MGLHGLFYSELYLAYTDYIIFTPIICACVWVSPTTVSMATLELWLVSDVIKRGSMVTMSHTGSHGPSSVSHWTSTDFPWRMSQHTGSYG